MKRKGEVEELVRRIVELEAELAEADKVADKRVASMDHLRSYWYSVAKKQTEDLHALQQDNARLQGKLQRRSRELGVQRAEVKKIDAMYCKAAQEGAEMHARDGQALEECRGTYGRLAHQVDVLHRLARVHFSPDEIDRALDSDAGAFAVVRGLKDVPA